MTRKIVALISALVIASCFPARAGEPRVFLNSSVDLGSAVDAINRQSPTKIVLYHSVAPNTPLEIRLEGVTLDEAITQIAQSEDLLAHRQGNAVMLGPCLDFTRLYNAVPPAAYAADPQHAFVYNPDPVGVLSMEPRRIYFDVTGGDVNDIAASMKAELPACSLVTADKRLGRIIVAGSRSTILRAVSLFQLLGASYDDVTPIPTSHRPASEILNQLRNALPDGTLIADDNARTILVTGPPALRARAKTLIAAIDVPVPEAWFSVWVVDYQPHQDTSNAGFQWGGKDLSGTVSVGSTATGFSSFSLPVNVTVNAFLQNTNSTILANTILRATNGKQDQWNVADVQSYGVTDLRTGSVLRQDVSAGLKAFVKPSIYSKDRLGVNVQLEYSDFIPSTNQFPSRTVRQIIMDPDLADGETAVLSGLMRDLDATTLSKVPGLANIPVLGGFFKNKQRTKNDEQIVVFVTAHIVKPGEAVPLSVVPRVPGLPQ